MFKITKDELARFIDQTNLNPAVTQTDMALFVKEAKPYGFRTVALMTSWVPLATQILEGSNTSIVTSVGFPLGTYPTESKVAETKWAINNGLKNIEIDMVMNISLFKSGRFDQVEQSLLLY